MRASHGLSFLAGFTYAHALDFVSAQGSQAGPMDIYHEHLNYGNGSNDVRNRFTFSTTYASAGPEVCAGATAPGLVAQCHLPGAGRFPLVGLRREQRLPGTGEVNAATSGNATGTSTDWNYTGPVSAFRAGVQWDSVLWPRERLHRFQHLRRSKSNSRDRRGRYHNLGANTMSERGRSAILRQREPHAAGGRGTRELRLLRPERRNYDAAGLRNDREQPAKRFPRPALLQRGFLGHQGLEIQGAVWRTVPSGVLQPLQFHGICQSVWRQPRS